MKIKGIPCALKSPVAVRLVKKFLARYRQESLPQRREGREGREEAADKL
jgi:hypothetical protein